ncbi:MAG: hypothetical protein HZB18_07740 [Chloroflexi bacterium]|nr:hypothetical protein [Chloroflexota bacterium]
MSEFSNKIREVLEVFRAKGEYDALSKDLDILIDLCDAVWRDGNWQDRENTVFFFHDNHALSENIPVEILENWAVDVLRSGKFQDENHYVRFYDLLQRVKKPSRKLVGLALVYILGLEISPAKKYIEFKKWILKPESSFKYELDTAKEIEKLPDEFSQLGLSLTDIVQRQFFVLVMRFYYEKGSFLDITDRDIENWRYAVRNKSSKTKDPLFDQFFPTQVEVIGDYIQSKNLGAIHRLFDRGFLKDEDGKFLPNDVLWGCIRIFYDNDVERAGRETLSILVFWVMERLDDKNNPIPLDVIQWMLTSGLGFLRELNFEAANKVYRSCISHIENEKGEIPGLFSLVGQIPTSIYEACSRNRQLFLLALFDKTKRKNKSEKDYLSEVDVRELHSISESSNDKYKEWGAEVFESAKENNWIRPEKEKTKDFHPSDTAPELVGYKKFVSRYLHSHAPEDIWLIMETIPELPLPIQFSSFLNWMEEARDNIKDIASEKPQQSAAADLHNLNWFQRLKKWFISLVAKNRKQSESGAPQARGEKSRHDHWVDLVKILNADSGYLYNKSITSVVRSLFHQIDERFLLMSIGTFLLHGNSVNALSAEDVAELAKINIKRFDGLLPLSLVAQLSPYLLKTPAARKQERPKKHIVQVPDREKATMGGKMPIPLWVRWALGIAGLLLIILILWAIGISKNVGAGISAAQTTQAVEVTLTPSIAPLIGAPSSTPSHTPTPTLTTTPAPVIAEFQDWDISTLLLYSRPKSLNSDKYEIVHLNKKAESSVFSPGEEIIWKDTCESLDWPFMSVWKNIPRINAVCYNEKQTSWPVLFSNLSNDGEKLLLVSDNDYNKLENSPAELENSRIRYSPKNILGVLLQKSPQESIATSLYLIESGGTYKLLDNKLELSSKLEANAITQNILTYDWVKVDTVRDPNDPKNNLNYNKERLLIVSENQEGKISLIIVWVVKDSNNTFAFYKTQTIVPYGSFDFIKVFDIDASPDGSSILVAGQISDGSQNIYIYNFSGNTDSEEPTFSFDQDYQYVNVNFLDDVTQVSWSPDVDKKQIAIAGKILDNSKLPQSVDLQGRSCEIGCLFVVDIETLKMGQQPKWIWITSIIKGIQHFWWTQWPQ